MGGQRHAPIALPPGKTRYPSYRWLVEASGLVWTGAENLATTGIHSPYRPSPLPATILTELPRATHVHSTWKYYESGIRFSGGKIIFILRKERTHSTHKRFALRFSGQYGRVVGRVGCIFGAEISYVLKTEAIHSFVILVTTHRPAV